MSACLETHPPFSSLSLSEDVTTESPPVAVKMVPYRDARGRRRWVAVEATKAAELERYDRWARRKDAEYRARHTTLTDLRAARDGDGGAVPHVALVGYLNCALEPAARAAGLSPDDGNPWEGPHRTFTHLIGEGEVWNGPAAWVELHIVAHYQTGNVVETSVYGVEAVSPARCPRCRGVRLQRHEVCLICCRCGGD